MSSKSGRYRSIAKLGFGGMAEVRLAIAQRAGGFNKLLVLKLLREELAADPEFLEMFLAEARVAALLNHPNIVQTNEVGAENNRYFIAMEYLDGQPLSAVISRLTRKNFPLDLHVFVLSQALHGLHYAHELTNLEGTHLALIHRDVSPQNVFVTYSGQVKLLDFGIAKVAGAAGLTKTGILKGKVGYMAPEQARMETKLDRRADIFAVGVMLWEAITQERFVESSLDEVAVLQARISNTDRKLSEVAPDADPVLAEICNKALAFDPNERWSTAQAFADALEGWLKKSKTALEKEFATLLTDTFRDERSRIRRVVEEASAKPALDGTSTSLDLRELVSSAALPPRTSAAPRSATPSVTVTGPSSATPKKGRSTGVLVLGGIAILGAGLFFQLRKPNAQSQTTPRAEASTAPSAPATIAIRVRTTPTNAKLTIDNGPPLATPYVGTREKEQGMHVLRVTADGYESEQRDITGSNDVDLDIALRPAAVADASTAPPTTKAAAPIFVGQAARPKTTAAPAADPVAAKPPPPPRKAKHSIDESDPYSNP
jgi:serine/threonine-protein kinase